MSKPKWVIVLTDQAIKELSKLDSTESEKIQKFLYEKLLTADDPRLYGKRLTGPLCQFWSYRVRKDYRIIANVHNNILTIEVVHVGHRKEVYKKDLVH